MQLYYRELGESAPDESPLIILHGLFGSSDNWLTVAKELAVHRRVYLTDLRNHGRSPWSEEFNYEVMSADLMEFVREHRIRQPVIIGHSMGGKTAMRYAVRYPSEFSQLMVVDIAPKYYPVHHGQILAGLRSIQLSTLQNRQQADTQLANYVPDLITRQFLLKNLYRDDTQGFSWRINLPVIDREIDRVGEALAYAAPVMQPTMFLRGGLSDYVQEGDLPLIRQIFPNSSLETIADAGHWIQAEKPKEFLEKVRKFVGIG
jgi:esterase